ncbi:MAG: phosphomannomutase/phosphoglucomutase [Clostridia bacterium]|nr:phosphomannomutase/phosphoglucomutase [Clostridia bacterium]
MPGEYWKHFKSGTDIRGIALEGVEGQHIDLTDEVIEKLAGAFALWLSEKLGKKTEGLVISIGRDSRLSGERIMAAAERALVGVGVCVKNVGMASTPAMFMTTVEAGCDGAVQITASHHPFNRNGLKFFTRSGGLESSDITALLDICESGRTAPAAEGKAEKLDFMSDYCAILRKLIVDGVGRGPKPLEGMKIAVDAGNGAGGFYASEVLAPLGADVSGSQFLEPDGRFPNHVPNPENEAAMESACKAVLESGSDMGVIFDTDVDRAGCVDGDGREINRNRLIALASVIALENNPGGTIVTDSITSSGLKTFIEKDLGGVHLRFKRGYKNVINEALRLNAEGINSPLAIETSGHAALRDNYFLDDGAYLATRIIIKAAILRAEGRKLGDLIASLKEPAESVELRFAITEADFASAGKRILADLESYAKAHSWALADDSREGVRVSFGADGGDGWFLLRLSVHDPVMPLNIESDSFGGCRVIAAGLLGFLKSAEGLDISAMEKYLGIR